MDMIEKEIKKAIDAQCFLAALTLALTIPSVCSKHEWPNEDYESNRYPRWCEKYIKNKILTCDKYYALRCEVLHHGSDNFKSQKILKHIRQIKEYRMNIPYTGRIINFEKDDEANRETFCAAAIISSITEAYKKFKEENPDFVYPLEKDLNDEI